MKAYLSPEEASLQLGISPREIRKYMRLGKLDLGLAIPPEGKKKHWKFRIYQGKINKIIGFKVYEKGRFISCQGNRSFKF